MAEPIPPIEHDDDDHYLVPTRGERINPVAFGRVLGRLDAQASDIQEIKEVLGANSEKMDQLLAYHHKQKGAISVLMVISSAIASVIGWFASHWFAR